MSRLLKSWTGYQLGINMQSGGPETSAKAQWFLEVFFISKANFIDL